MPKRRAPPIVQAAPLKTYGVVQDHLVTWGHLTEAVYEIVEEEVARLKQLGIVENHVMDLVSHMPGNLRATLKGRMPTVRRLYPMTPDDVVQFYMDKDNIINELGSKISFLEAMLRSDTIEALNIYIYISYNYI